MTIKKNYVQKWGLEKIFCAHIGNYTPEKCQHRAIDRERQRQRQERDSETETYSR